MEQVFYYKNLSFPLHFRFFYLHNDRRPKERQIMNLSERNRKILESKDLIWPTERMAFFIIADQMADY
jgi:hypothetical protein